VETECAQLPAQLDNQKFRTGDRVKVVFRPEDISLSRTDFLKPGHLKLGPAHVEEVSFVGAYERLRLRLERPGEECENGEPSYYLTTETPENRPHSIIATRPKPEASSTQVHIGDRVVVAVTSFTVLPGS